MEAYERFDESDLEESGKILRALVEQTEEYSNDVISYLENVYSKLIFHYISGKTLDKGLESEYGRWKSRVDYSEFKQPHFMDTKHRINNWNKFEETLEFLKTQEVNTLIGAGVSGLPYYAVALDYLEPENSLITESEEICGNKDHPRPVKWIAGDEIEDLGTVLIMDNTVNKGRTAAGIAEEIGDEAEQIYVADASPNYPLKEKINLVRLH